MTVNWNTQNQKKSSQLGYVFSRLVIPTKWKQEALLCSWLWAVTISQWWRWWQGLQKQLSGTQCFPHASHCAECPAWLAMVQPHNNYGARTGLNKVSSHGPGAQPGLTQVSANHSPLQPPLVPASGLWIWNLGQCSSTPGLPLTRRGLAPTWSWWSWI